MHCTAPPSRPPRGVCRGVRRRTLVHTATPPQTLGGDRDFSGCEWGTEAPLFTSIATAPRPPPPPQAPPHPKSLFRGRGYMCPPPLPPCPLLRRCPTDLHNRGTSAPPPPPEPRGRGGRARPAPPPPPPGHAPRPQCNGAASGGGGGLGQVSGRGRGLASHFEGERTGGRRR